MTPPAGTRPTPPRFGLRAETPSARVRHGRGAESDMEGLGTREAVVIEDDTLTQALLRARYRVRAAAFWAKGLAHAATSLLQALVAALAQ